MTSRLTASDTRGEIPREDAGRLGGRGSAWIGRSPRAISVAVLLLSVPVCFLCALMLDVPLARLTLRVPPHLRSGAQFFSDLGLSGYMLISSALVAGGAFAALRGERYPRHAPVLRIVAERAFFVFASVGLSGIAVQILKHLVGRARPGLIDRFGAFHFDLFSIKASLASFPSGHSTSIFALAVAIGLIAPRLIGPMFGLAVAVAAARVILGSHYASDIVAGAALGVITTLLVARFLALRSIAFDEVGGVLALKEPGLVASVLRSARSSA